MPLFKKAFFSCMRKVLAYFAGLNKWNYIFCYSLFCLIGLYFNYGISGNNYLFVVIGVVLYTGLVFYGPARGSGSRVL